MNRKSQLKKKLAIALSMVNVLNTMAPVALPYVTVTNDMCAKGGAIVRT